MEHLKCREKGSLWFTRYVCYDLFISSIILMRSCISYMGECYTDVYFSANCTTGEPGKNVSEEDDLTLYTLKEKEFF